MLVINPQYLYFFDTTFVQMSVTVTVIVQTNEEAIRLSKNSILIKRNVRLHLFFVDSYKVSSVDRNDSTQKHFSFSDRVL